MPKYCSQIPKYFTARRVCKTHLQTVFVGKKLNCFYSRLTPDAKSFMLPIGHACSVCARARMCVSACGLPRAAYAGLA